jgi:hypothetical protein
MQTSGFFLILYLHKKLTTGVFKSFKIGTSDFKTLFPWAGFPLAMPDMICYLQCKSAKKKFGEIGFAGRR